MESEYGALIWKVTDWTDVLVVVNANAGKFTHTITGTTYHLIVDMNSETVTATAGNVHSFKVKVSFPPPYVTMCKDDANMFTIIIKDPCTSTTLRQ